MQRATWSICKHDDSSFACVHQAVKGCAGSTSLMRTSHCSRIIQARLRPEATSLRRGAGTSAAAASASRLALCCIASAAICWYALQNKQRA